MTTPERWQRASHSGSGDGNNCVEIARSPARTAIRDSKHPTHGPLSFPSPAFNAFVEALKSGSGNGLGDE
ncbi:DUF397 domain-containing protein [Streptomyces sp. NRRL S-37]|uniref:DUF397 domain-containing protein n=1 Tax=Streptomyces sp. NRRL S-37 TaxID=1463903 RepID=UPI00099B3392|nr:DUF397 domain-containing protein [Streptomyces sp. NRRL S-37]